MIKRENVISGYEIIVNDKRNVLIPDINGLMAHKTFYIGDEVWIEPKTKIICLSKVKSSQIFSGKIVDVEISGKPYKVYWMELRIQTDPIK